MLSDEVRALIAAQAATIARQQVEIDGQEARIALLRGQLAKLRRLQFGRSSEKLDAAIVQLELALEDLEEESGAKAAAQPSVSAASELGKAKPSRRPLPPHLPRDVTLHQAACVCPACGGTLRLLGEDVTEVLDYVPASFRVTRHVRPKVSCRSCETITQAPAPSLPIRRGRAGAGLLAHVLVAKFCDHLPLYRQSEIYAREGVELERSTLADWVGQASALMRPLVEALERHVLAAERLHADDTPVPVLAPGTGKTSTGRLWAYLRDERSYAGTAPPAVRYRYTPDRRGEHPRAHLAGFRGVLQADGYAGFGGLYEGGLVVEAACWAHVRRKFHDIHAAGGTSPLAREALERIGKLYAIEERINGKPPDQRRRPPSRGPAAAGRPQGLARGHAHQAAWPQRCRIRHPLRPVPVGGTGSLRRGRHHRDRQQPGREGHAAGGARPKELAVCRIRRRRRARRRDLQPDRHRQAERPRSGSLPAPRHRLHRRPPGEPRRRTAALEYRHNPETEPGLILVTL